jgi:hypothetical protein
MNTWKNVKITLITLHDVTLQIFHQYLSRENEQLETFHMEGRTTFLNL